MGLTKSETIKKNFGRWAYNRWLLILYAIIKKEKEYK